jgi:hypothetical protein
MQEALDYVDVCTCEGLRPEAIVKCLMLLGGVELLRRLELIQPTAAIHTASNKAEIARI